MSDALLELSRDDLFARLALGRAGGTTVVTPNRRLAQSLAAEFDRRQHASGLSVWETADVLPYAAFVDRLYEDALHSELADRLPLLLGPDQEQSLWEDVVRRRAGSALLAVAQTAALAREAWALAHAWDLADGLPGALAGEDAVEFAAWAREYATRTGREHFTDRARLAAVAAEVLEAPRVRKPALLVVYGFDAITPQQAALLEALAARGVTLARAGPLRREAQAVRVACADARAEFRLAARWARARLEANPDARIAIVVPELQRHKRELRRALAEVLRSGRVRAACCRSTSRSATRSPRVRSSRTRLPRSSSPAARRVRAREPADPLAVHRAARDRGAGRARLDAWCAGAPGRPSRSTARRDAAAQGRTPRARGAARATPSSARRGSFARSRPPRGRERFSEALTLIGFPGGRGLDSAEYQTLQKWHEVVAGFAMLDRVAPRIGYDAALWSRLRRMAAETLFQPETPEVPIQVLGVLEGGRHGVRPPVGHGPHRRSLAARAAAQSVPAARVAAAAGLPDSDAGRRRSSSRSGSPSGWRAAPARWCSRIRGARAIASSRRAR